MSYHKPAAQLTRFIKKLTPAKKNFLLVTSIIILTILVNLNLFKIPFLYDDFDFLFTWPSIQNFNHLPALLHGETPLGHEGVYRPLRSFIYVLSYHFEGRNIFYYHLQELAVYALIIIFVYFITWEMFKKSSLAFFTALFYALLPIHIENIAYLVSNFDTIGAFLFFLTFFLFQKYLEVPKKQKNLYLSTSLITSFLAYCTYEITLALPLIIFLYAFYKSKKDSFLSFIFYLFPAFIYLFIRVVLLHIVNRGTLFNNLPIKIINTSNGLISYITNSIIAQKEAVPSLSWTYVSLEFSKVIDTASNNGNYTSFIPFFLLIILLALAIHRFLKRRITGFGFIWFFASLLPVIIISFQSTGIGQYTWPLNTRYAIIATFGLALIIANWLLSLLKFSPKNPMMLYLKILCIALIITFTLINALTNYNNLNNWKDPRPALLKQINTMKQAIQKNHRQRQGLRGRRNGLGHHGNPKSI